MNQISTARVKLVNEQRVARPVLVTISVALIIVFETVSLLIVYILGPSEIVTANTENTAILPWAIPILVALPALGITGSIAALLGIAWGSVLCRIWATISAITTFAGANTPVGTLLMVIFFAFVMFVFNSASAKAYYSNDRAYI